jgi:hypothetical protein
MASPASDIELLDQLRERIQAAVAESGTMRAALARADVAGIESATERLQTIALELKLLEAERRRRPTGGRDVPAGESLRVRRELEAMLTRLARVAAVDGGVLERLVSLGHRLIDAIYPAGESYLPSGRPREIAGRGLRLREKA